MNLKNCVECGNIMVDNPSGLCPNCLRFEDEAEDKVAEFLRGTDKASIDEIAKATGVKPKIILRMIKRGRITSDVPISYPCDTCGALITEGRLCAACAQNITSQLNQNKPEQQPARPKQDVRREDRMYINDMLKKR